MSVTVNGIPELVAKLARISNESKRMASAIVQSTADTMVADIKINAPADLGQLRQSAGKDSINDGMGATVFVAAAYAAFVEFGTGTFVSVPPELAELASQFQGVGLGSWEDFKLAIQGWASRHGIDQKFVYVIMLQILHNGIKPQPFFYPAYMKAVATLKPKLELALRQYLSSQNVA